MHFYVQYTLYIRKCRGFRKKVTAVYSYRFILKINIYLVIYFGLVEATRFQLGERLDTVVFQISSKEYEL
jgi:hypothetical protein